VIRPGQSYRNKVKTALSPLEKPVKYRTFAPHLMSGKRADEKINPFSGKI
jgi:hypothetical protein